MNIVPYITSNYRNRFFSNVKMMVFDMVGNTINEKGIVYDTLYNTIKDFGLDINKRDMNKWHGVNKY